MVDHDIVFILGVNNSVGKATINQVRELASDLFIDGWTYMIDHDIVFIFGVNNNRSDGIKSEEFLGTDLGEDGDQPRRCIHR